MPFQTNHLKRTEIPPRHHRHERIPQVALKGIAKPQRGFRTQPRVAKPTLGNHKNPLEV
ncbi:hypothetical protein [Rubritalea tangerina]|uniref:hypothetical protein n=1 Tax=Rubritalea tangerina TaxID=430798 RepID=UPI0036186586